MHRLHSLFSFQPHQYHPAHPRRPSDRLPFLSQVLAVLYLSPVHPRGAALEARLTALKVADMLVWDVGLNCQRADVYNPFKKYAACYIDQEMAGTLSTVVSPAHDPRSQCPLSTLTKHDTVCYEPPDPEVVPLIYDPRSQCPLSSLTKHDLVCYEPPAPEVVPLVHDSSSQCPISSLTESDLACYDPPDPDDVPPASHDVCLSTDRADYIEDDEVEMCAVPAYFYEGPVNGSSIASELFAGLDLSWFGLADRGEQYTPFTETVVIKEADGMPWFLPTTYNQFVFLLGLIMLVMACTALFPAFGTELVFAVSLSPVMDFYIVFDFTCVLDCAELAYHGLLYHFVSDADDPSANAGRGHLYSDIGDNEQALLRVNRPGHLPSSTLEPSIANSSVPSMESDMSSGVSTFATTTFEVSYFDGTRRIIATVVLGSSNGSNVFELIGIYKKSETAYGPARDSEFESESDMHSDDSSVQSQPEAHDYTSDALVLSSEKDSLTSSAQITELIETRGIDGFITASSIGESGMPWNRDCAFMSFFRAQVAQVAHETLALEYHPLTLRRRRKSPRGCRGKGGKGKKGTKTVVSPTAVLSEPEAGIALSSMYKRPLANSSLPSLDSDNSSTASSVSLITLDDSHSGGDDSSVVNDATSISETRTLVSAVKEDRPSFAQKFNDLVHGHRTDHASKKKQDSTVTATLEEVSEVSRPRKKAHRGTSHRGKGGKGKESAENSTETPSEPATATAGVASMSNDLAASARPVHPRFGSIFAKTVSSVRSSAGRARQPSV